MFISSFSFPSSVRERPHFLKLLITVSLFLLISFQASATHFVKRTRLCHALNLLSVYNCKLSLICFSCWRLTSSLNGLFTLTSRGCTRLVQPGGTLTNSVLYFPRAVFTASVCWAVCTSATKIFPDEQGLCGFVNVLLHSLSIHAFMIASSHQALSWMTGEITGEERKAPEGTWVLGGGIELPCSYFIYGNRKKKADVRGKLRKAERSLYGIWTTATNKLATESGTEIKFSCDFDGIRYIEILLKNRCCNWFIIINMSLMYRLIIVNCIRYPV